MLSLSTFVRRFRGVDLPPIHFEASPNHSARSASVSLVVVHDTEGGYAGSVSWLKNSQAQASAHVVLREDGKEATQLVRYADKAWHCAAYNSESIGLEMAGIASHGFDSDELRVAARIVAFFCHKYKLPPKHVKPSANGPIARGFTFHQDLGVKGGGHHDPGFTAAQAENFEALVQDEYKRGGFRRWWGV